MRLAHGSGDVKAYDVSGRAGSSLAASLSVGAAATAAERRSRHRSELRQRDVHLLYDFEFPSVSSQILETRDGNYIVATGTYPPQVHVYDTEQLSLKFQRNLASDIVRMELLGDDWRKMAFLCADRYVELHAQFGAYYRLRVPKFGRDLALDRGSCDLYVVGVGEDIWRLNLEQGRFLRPLGTGIGNMEDDGINCVEVAWGGRLVAAGCTDGCVQVWDPRMSADEPAGKVDVTESLGGESKITAEDDVEISSLGWARSGIKIAVGVSSGQSLLFDLRSNRPQVIKEQGYGLPVVSVKMHGDGKHVLSADRKCIKVWNQNNAKNFGVIEPDADVNDLCVIGNSGVLCAAVEAARVRSYYIPTLGPAPKWCAHLDTVTEELEDGIGAGGGVREDAESVVYENYKFVTKDDLEDLGLLHLIGSDLLKPYMHGFFINLRLHRRAVDVSQPFAYEKYRKEQARKKIESERESRIGKVRKRSLRQKPKVNIKLAETLLERARKKNPHAVNVLEDTRFRAMFEDEQYAVDEEAERYKILNPVASSTKHRKQMEEVAESDSEAEKHRALQVKDDQSEIRKTNGANPDGLDSWSTSEEGDPSEDSSDDTEAIAKPRGPRSKRRIRSNYKKRSAF